LRSRFTVQSSALRQEKEFEKKPIYPKSGRKSSSLKKAPAPRGGGNLKKAGAIR
jgi:hypothetical protein